MAERLLHKMDRRASVEAVAAVRVPEPMRRDGFRQSGLARGGFHDPANLRRVERPALAGAAQAHRAHQPDQTKLRLSLTS